MTVNACPPECKGPFADLAASRSTYHRDLNDEAHDEQRFQSVLQRLSDASQQTSAPASRQPSYSHTPQRSWPPPKPRNPGVRVPELPPSTTRAPGSFTGYSYPGAYSSDASGHYRGGQSTQRSGFPGPPSHGPIAPASGSDKQRMSSA
ncbi:hypothetical protein LA080_012088 [Diaporthe eres]|nr:hypothetical protein LA080_012088 [Diaporthe eres]